MDNTNMKYSLNMTESQYDEIRTHLFPTDNNEAISIILCGAHNNSNITKFFIHKIFHVPYDLCPLRTNENVTWPTSFLEPILEEAEKKKLSIFKIHSHDKIYSCFSETDDKSDKELFPQIYLWMNSEQNHGSLIMLSDGKMIGRVALPNGNFCNISTINKVGHSIGTIQKDVEISKCDGEFAIRHRQLFGEDTFNKLRKLKVTVVGCSGTGSFVVEQLARLGIGELILIDPDVVELKNLNRIVNSFYDDAIQSTPKVTALEKAINNMGTGTKVTSFQSNLYNREVINEVANSDVLFGCMDSVDGRNLLNRISNFYLLPYFDLGVKLVSDGMGGVEYIVGTVHYLQPGNSTLLGRNVYTLNDLNSADLLRTDPNEYKKQLKEKYIKGIDVEKPAVISVNNQISALAINDFLARIHSYRYDENNRFASTSFNFCDWDMVSNDEDFFDQTNIFKKYMGRGNMTPLLDMPVFSERRSLMKKILSWFKNLFRRKYNFKLSEEFLDDLEKNTIHLIGTTPHFDFIQMECPCGCREQIKLSLIDIDKPHWKVKILNKNIFISPSIWRTKGCKSHFFIKDSRLIWAENKSSFSFLKILYKYLGAI